MSGTNYNEPGGKSDAFVFKEFLLDPYNKKQFMRFFSSCLATTCSYLGYLVKKGYKILVAGGTESGEITDLACDVLGLILSSRRNRPFYRVFDYLQSSGIVELESVPADDLFDRFTIFLRRSIRQELSRLRKESDPQIENLKRRFKDILKSADFGREQPAGTSNCLVYSVSNENNLKLEKPSVPYDRLLRIAEETYMSSANRKRWCLAIFEELGNHEEYCNCIPEYQLLSAAVAVNACHAEIDGGYQFRPLTQREYAVRQEIYRERAKTLSETTTDRIDYYVKKKSITTSEGDNLYRACALYLSDLCDGGSTAPLPTYFRESMPKETHTRFLKHYKNIFETIINKTVEDFRQRLANNPTIRALGGYSIDEP